jgi:CheY-like chemotaxis protein
MYNNIGGVMPKRKLLLVEEDRVNRFLCKRIFESEGFDVTLAAVSDAPGLASSLQPDVIVIELGAPGEVNLEAVSTLKGAMETCDIPVVGMLSDVTADGCRKAIKAGCVGCTGKRYNYPLSFIDPESYKAVFYEMAPFKSAVVGTVEKTSRITSAERTVKNVFGQALADLQESYRTGSIVELSNGVLCMVKEPREDTPSRPVVQVLIDESGNHPDKGELLDLQFTPQYYIRALVTPAA